MLRAAYAARRYIPVGMRDSRRTGVTSAVPLTLASATFAFLLACVVHWPWRIPPLTPKQVAHEVVKRNIAADATRPGGRGASVQGAERG